MVSRGFVTALRTTWVDPPTGKPHLLNEIVYTLGGMESISSGSGVFSVTKNTPIWKGTLTGGTYQITYYSDFSSYYPKIKKWLVGIPVNPDIEQFYKKYLAYFGKKSGENYVSKGYTYQNFVNGKSIALDNASKDLYWWDGTKWTLGQNGSK